VDGDNFADIKAHGMDRGLRNWLRLLLAISKLWALVTVPKWEFGKRTKVNFDRFVRIGLARCKLGANRAERFMVPHLIFKPML